MTTFGFLSENGHGWQPTELVNTLLSANARAVVKHWMSDRRFLDASNEPTLLPMTYSDGDGFGALVAQVNQDLTPTVIFNELLRKGIIEQQDNGALLLRRSAYVPGIPVDSQAFAIAEAPAEHASGPRRRRNDYR